MLQRTPASYCELLECQQCLLQANLIPTHTHVLTHTHLRIVSTLTVKFYLHNNFFSRHEGKLHPFNETGGFYGHGRWKAWGTKGNKINLPSSYHRLLHFYILIERS